MGDRFEITVESIYLSNDRGKQENIFNLSNNIIKSRIVEILDIANDQIDDQDFVSDYDPKLYHSSKTNRSALSETWLVNQKLHFIIFVFISKLL